MARVSGSQKDAYESVSGCSCDMAAGSFSSLAFCRFSATWLRCLPVRTPWRSIIFISRARRRLLLVSSATVSRPTCFAWHLRTWLRRPRSSCGRQQHCSCWRCRRWSCATRNACWRKPSCRAAEIKMPRMMLRLAGVPRTKSRSGPFPLESHLQIALRNRRVGCQCRRRARPHDLALLDDRVPVGQLQQRGEMFVDEQNGLALRLQARKAFPDFKPQQRRQPLGRLVEDEQLGIRHQGAADRQHLLLAAGEFVAHVAAPLRELGKKIVDPLERPSRHGKARSRGRDQILLDGEGGKDLPALGN